jgi:peptide/nickel transport system ATP-binding protein
MTQDILRGLGLKKYFTASKGLSLFGQPQLIKAVDDVDISIKPKEIVAIVGESGSGKTTLGQLLVGAIKPSYGKVVYRGEDISQIPAGRMRSLRRKLQIIYQDPFESVDPRFTVFDIVSEGVLAHDMVSDRSQLRSLLRDALETVGLIPASQFIDRYPHQLSGGQLQRVAFARAAILNPEIIVADEPVSMLDVSIKAEVVNTMLDLRDTRGIAFVFITHDFAWARYASDRIAVMYLGKIVEFADTDELFANPLHPYTRALMAATPSMEVNSEPPKVLLKGEINHRLQTDIGCVLAPRCPHAFERCSRETPVLKEVSTNHYVSCHLF